uniref:Uncharacterized protein n=1 Tax=Mola mola TaxID=94237 RepID=A0A3Q3WBJ2_MOLML
LLVTQNDCVLLCDDCFIGKSNSGFLLCMATKSLNFKSIHLLQEEAILLYLLRCKHIKLLLPGPDWMLAYHRHLVKASLFPSAHSSVLSLLQRCDAVKLSSFTHRSAAFLRDSGV